MSNLILPEFDDELIEVPHPFEIDLNVLVKVNYELTIESIGDLERGEIANIRENVDDRDLKDSMIRDQEFFCDELRRSANHLAAVGLVTRFQHWIEKFAKRVEDPTKTETGLCNRLKQLNQSLGERAPVPVDFFEDLVAVRDSIIHGDSKATWQYGNRKRKIADHFRGCTGELQITDDQLGEAIQKTIEQVKWYDERLRPR